MSRYVFHDQNPNLAYAYCQAIHLGGCGYGEQLAEVAVIGPPMDLFALNGIAI